jgi:hypothetical protein
VIQFFGGIHDIYLPWQEQEEAASGDGADRAAASDATVDLADATGGSQQNKAGSKLESQEA